MIGKKIHLEIERLKQLLTSNNMPMKRGKNFIASKFQINNNSNSTVENEMKFYFENQMTSSYKTKETKLRSIVDQHLSTVYPDEKKNLKFTTKLRKSVIYSWKTKYNKMKTRTRKITLYTDIRAIGQAVIPPTTSAIRRVLFTSASKFIHKMDPWSNT